VIKGKQNIIERGNIPRHIAVIMDGNGRWAREKGAARVFGHRNAISAVRNVTEGCAELGVEVLTLYVFSTENWGRPKEEVNALMDLMLETIVKELDNLKKNNVRLALLGDLMQMPEKSRRSIARAVRETADGNGLLLQLAISYSGRWEIAAAAQKLAQDIASGKARAEQVNENLFGQYLQTAGQPDPELLIRTGGEQRISNFLLWQMAYTEFYFMSALWPNFTKNDLYSAVDSYQKRERRFGLLPTQSRVK